MDLTLPPDIAIDIDELVSAMSPIWKKFYAIQKTFTAD